MAVPRTWSPQCWGLGPLSYRAGLLQLDLRYNRNQGEPAIEPEEHAAAHAWRPAYLARRQEQCTSP